MTFLTGAGIFVLVFGIYVFITSVSNFVYFKKMACIKPKSFDGRGKSPLVSVIVPARNEEKNLPVLIDSVLAQTCKNFELLIMDDQSTDGTLSVIQEYEKKDPRVKGWQLPEGPKKHRHGKMNVLINLIPHAKGRYLLCMDADTSLRPDCLAYALTVMEKHDLDMISGFAAQHVPFGAASIIAAIGFAIAFVPHAFIWLFAKRSVPIAIGQFIMMKKSAYEQTGGYAALSENVVVDDVGIAALFSKKGKRYAVLSLADYVDCRMYGSTKDAFWGIARSVIGFFGTNPFVTALIILGAVALIPFFLSPVIMLLVIFLTHASTVALLFTTGTVLLWFGWFLSSVVMGWSAGVSASYPLTAFAVSCMLFAGTFRRLTGKKVYWKGREVEAIESRRGRMAEENGKDKNKNGGRK